MSGQSPSARVNRWPSRTMAVAIAVVTVLLAAGVSGALTLSRTAAGRDFTLTRALERIEPTINGRISVDSLASGGLFSGATLHDIEVSDSLGQPLIRADSASAHYSLTELIRGNATISELELWQPTVVVAEGADGRNGLVALFGSDEEQSESVATPFRILGVRIHQGTLLLRDTDGSERRFEDVSAKLDRVDILPTAELYASAQVDELAFSHRTDSGTVQLVDLNGSVEVGPTGWTMVANHLRLPASEGSGSLRFSSGTSAQSWQLVTELDFTQLALTDLAWLDPRLDHGTATGAVRILFDSDGWEVESPTLSTNFATGTLALAGGVSSRDLLGFHDLTITAGDLPTAEFLRWLPDRALPVESVTAGALVTADVRISGQPGRITVDGNVTLTDANNGRAVTTVTGSGTFLGTRAFEDLQAEITYLDGRFPQAIHPALQLRGPGEMRIHADGDLATTKGLAITAELQHTGYSPLPSRPGGERRAVNQPNTGDPAAPEVPEANAPTTPALPSSVTVTGTIFGDDPVTALDMSATLEAVSLVLLAELFPGANLATSGQVSGTASFAGDLAQMEIATELSTPGGDLTANGQVNLQDFGDSYAIDLAAQDLSLAQLFTNSPDSTVLTGTVTLEGEGFTQEDIQGSFTLAAGSSQVGPLHVDSLVAQGRIGSGLLTLASLYADVSGVTTQAAGGSIGVAPGTSGEGVTLALTSASIAPLRPLFMQESPNPDVLSDAQARRFAGSLRGEIAFTGSLDSLLAAAKMTFTELAYGPNSAAEVAVDLTAEGLTDPALLYFSPSKLNKASTFLLDGTVTAEAVQLGDREFSSVRLEGSSELAGQTRLRALISRSEEEFYEAQAVVLLGSDSGRVDLDRLTLVFPDRRWNLRGPASFEWSPEALVVNDFGLIRPGVEGLRTEADGELILRGDRHSDFSLSISDLELALVARLLQIDRLPTGILTTELRVDGTGTAPEWDASINLADSEYEWAGAEGLAGDRSLSFDEMQLAGHFADNLVTLEVQSWTDGKLTLSAQGSLPLELDPVSIPDAPVDLQIVADSFPVAMILGFVSSAEDFAGTVSGEVALGGVPSDLAPNGSLRIAEGALSIPGLGETFRISSVNTELELQPDGTVVVQGVSKSGGQMRIGGTLDASDIRDLDLSSLGFNLAFWPDEFRVVDRHDMIAAVSGDSITLTGSFGSPEIRGDLEVVEGTVFVEEFRRSAEAASFYGDAFYDTDLFSTTTGLFPGAVATNGNPVVSRNVFLENLDVDITMDVGRGNWLRSPELNVETSGDLRLIFNRQSNQLILDGDIEVVRGTYSIPPRTLNVSEGIFRFTGTPGFNPELLVTASTRLRTREGEPITITADISGPLNSTPTPVLSSDAQSAISQADLYSYLVVGQPASALIAGASVGAGRNLLLGQVTSQLSHLLLPELDLHHLSVSQADQGQANAVYGVSSLQVEVGRYVTDNIFLTGVYQRSFCGDPTLPVNSPGLRVEVGLPKEVTLEGFLEDRCTRERFRGLGRLSLQRAQIWGFSVYREWGY